MKRYLVLANQTLGGEHLAEAVRERLLAGPCTFHVVVPATPSSEHVTYTEGGAESLARERLDKELARFAEMGAEATGEVGDADPLMAARDAALQDVFDEVIVSTLHVGASRWLKLDLPHRLGKAMGLPVTHIEASPEEGPA